MTMDGWEDGWKEEPYTGPRGNEPGSPDNMAAPTTGKQVVATYLVLYCRACGNPIEATLCSYQCEHDVTPPAERDEETMEFRELRTEVVRVLGYAEGRADK